MKTWIRWFSQNHVAGNFLMLLIILAGVSTWFSLRKEIFPETSLDAVQIAVTYPSATPEEVEEGVIVPIEEAIAEVEGIKRISSTAASNIGVVIVEVETGWEVREVMSDVQTQVEALDNLAEEAEKPIFEELTMASQVLSVTLSAEANEATLRSMAEDLREALLTSDPPPAESLSERLSRFFAGPPTISKVELSGVRPYEISIEVSARQLERYGLTLGEVAQQVQANSLDLPGGSVRTEAGEILVRATGKSYGAEEFAKILIRSGLDGAEVQLGDLAVVRDGFEEVDVSSTFNGRPAVVLNVFRVGQEDTLRVVNLVKKILADYEATRLPPGAELAIWNDMSQMLQGRLDLLMRNMGIGLLLVLVVLALFLRPSLACLVALGIPVSFAGGVWLMEGFDLSVNMISAFAFILVLGIVVDDAIVVGENVYTRIQGGEDPREAAWKGTHEVGTVVIFGVLTTMAAFTPMLGLSGVSGKIWPNIPLVVIPVLAFSLVQSKFVLPSHLATLKASGQREKVGPLTRLQRRVAGGLEWFVERVYAPFLDLAMRFRYVVLAAFLALMMLVMGLVQGKWIPSEFMPAIEGEVLSAKLEMPRGVPFERTEEVVARLAQAMRELEKTQRGFDGQPLVRNMLATAGMQPFQTGFTASSAQGSYLGEVTVELIPASQRAQTLEQLKVQWQELVGDIPGLVELTFVSETGAGGNAIDVNLVGADRGELVRATNWAKERLAEYPGAIEISDSNRLGREEIRLIRLKPAGQALGLNLDQIIGQVRDAFYGREVQTLQRGRNEVKVFVRYPEVERRSLHNLEEMKIRTPEGQEVRLLDVVELKFERGLASIQRIDRQKAITLRADVDTAGGYNSNEIVGDWTLNTLEKLGEKFPGVRFVYQGEQSDQNDSVREMGIGFLFALVLIYVLMAIPLKSYIQPVIIMAVIPFGIIGAILGHLVMGLNLSIMTMCGVVALSGVVVNDSLVMVDYINRHRAETATLREAVVQAGQRRFRPIILTSLTTFVGIMPMVAETDLQARFLIPMAVSLGFGILFATFITLLLLPGVYLMVEDVGGLWGRVRRGIFGGEKEASR